MPAGQVYLLLQTRLLFKSAYWLSAAARWMLAGSLPLSPACELMLCFPIRHTCWYGVSLSAVTAGEMPHYRPYLLMCCLNFSPAVLVWCLSIGHAFLLWCLTTGNGFWCGASLSAMPAGVLPHYRSCLLHGASLPSMHIGVLPHFRPCLLVWCQIINHACCCGSLL